MNAYRVNPDNAQTLNNLGFTLTKLKRFAEAAGYLQKSIKIQPNYVEAVINLGKLQEQSGSETEAIDLLKAILSRGEATTEIRLLLGKLLLQKERFAEASDTIRSALRRDPSHSEGHTLLGILNVKTGRKKRALSRFNKALELSPSNLEARYQRILLLHEAGEYEASCNDLEYIFKWNPNFFQTKLLLAETYLQTGNIDRSLELYQELKEQFPESERILHQLVFLYKQKGDKSKALSEAENLIILQEQEEDPESMKKMETSLAVYEEIINDFDKEYDTMLNRNISLYLEEIERISLSMKQQEEESLLVDAFPDLDKEVVPIIDFGGIEPIIEVNEEDREVLHLQEMEEVIELPDEKEDIETIKAALLQEQAKNAMSSNPTQNNPAEGSAGSPQTLSPFPRQQMVPPPGFPVQQHYPPVQVVSVPQVIIAQPQAVSGTQPPPRIIVQYNQGQPEGEKPLPKKEERDRRKNDEYINTSVNPADLFGYLENLTQYLPDEKKKDFDESEMKLKIETLQAKISGKPGLAQLIEKRYRKGDTLESKEVLSHDKVKSTFKFMNSLADYLPDKTVSSTIKHKIDHILTMMKDVHGKRKTP